MGDGDAQEAEQILLLALGLSLREVGGVPESVRSVAAVTAEVLVSIVSRSVVLIDEFEEREARPLPQRLPSGAASRHRLCTQIAGRLKELGFGGEIGYNQLLYPSEASTRALLTWLVDRLPRTDEERGGAQEAMDASTVLRFRMAERVGTWTRENWRLPTLRPKGKVVSGARPRRWQTWKLGPAFDKAPLVSRQVPEGADVLPSLLELAAANAIATARAEAALDADDLLAVVVGDDEKETPAPRLALGAASEVDFGWGSRASMPSLRDMVTTLERAARGESDETETASLGRLAHAAWFTHGDDSAAQHAAATKKQQQQQQHVASEAADHEAVAARAEGAATVEETSAVSKLTKVLEKLGEEYQGERKRAVQFESEREAASRRALELEGELESARKRQETLEREYTVRRKTLEMLPESQEAIGKLREICAASQRRLADLQAEWERHRTPLARQIAEKRDERARRRARARAMVDEMKRCRAEMQQMVLDVADKDERAKLLDAEYAKMPKNVNRTLYTYRIMDIIGSIAKQKTEIAKIIDDIRLVQKDNNKVGETLRRTEAIADERVYQEAKAQKSDPAMVQSYRYLSDLRQLFENLVSVIDQNGRVTRDARDYETKSKQLQSRVDANNLRRILDDLQQVRAENEKTLHQLKASRSTFSTS
ncbi:hypothetical protein CTAYLR_007364 [Chrysophaeum taylorii]|uniref:Coiled-coil domain-containing protein 22 homolog n=1 Tax=Chrysophaeum taylorii TaxID=2483200 RepID=A0AAD7XG95_9STRA|nr:hypothetical protein CTAYLR_007364 [Chrysophaeum taylorii]